MFMMHMAWTFRLGDRATVTINGAPAELWWKDRDTLVIDGTDARRINERRPVDDNLQMFICSDADGNEFEVGDETNEGFIVGPKKKST